MIGIEQSHLKITGENKGVTHLIIAEPPQWTSWQLGYADGSTYENSQGHWNDAPQKYVESLEIWYGADYPGGPFLSETPRAAFYFFNPDMGYPVHTWEWMSRVRQLRQVKFGTWVSRSMFQATRQKAQAVKRPFPAWTIFYADGLEVSERDSSWEEAPMDNVVFIRGRDGALIHGHDYYYWQNGRLINTESVEQMLTSTPEMKLGVTSHVMWPHPINPLIERIKK